MTGTNRLDFSLNYNLGKILSSHDQIEENLEQLSINFPVGKWGKISGEFGKESALYYFGALKDNMREYMKISEKDYMKLVDECRQEFNDENIKGYFTYNRFV